MEGVDYSTARPNLDALWNAGIRFVSRYLAYLPNPKVLTKGELDALHAKGFTVVLNWEQATGDMLRGYSVGVQHAREALRQANALGAPVSVPIYFSCDVDTSPADWPAVAAYLDGARSVLSLERTGVYGEADLINAMVPGHAMWGWQTYAWSRGLISPKAHFLQYQNNVTINGQSGLDRDSALKANFGGWSNDMAGEIADKALGTLDGGNALGDVYLRVVTGKDNKGKPSGDGASSANLTNIVSKLDALLARPVTVLTDTQVTALAQQLAKESDATVVETALRNVLKKGVDNAG